MRLIFLVVIFLAFAASIKAQIKVKWQSDNSFLITPDQIWRATVMNSGEEIQSAYLKATIKNKQSQLIFIGTTLPFSLPKGSTVISPLSVTQSTAEYYDNAIKEKVSSTGRFPDDDYVICIELLNNADQVALDQDCREKASVNFSPPRLRTPEDNASVDANRLLLTWIPPKPIFADAGINYTVRIVEIFPNQTPVEAIASNPVWFEAADIVSTSLLYPGTAAPLQVEKKYAWQVQAYAGDNYAGKKHIGQTEVWQFNLSLVREEEEESSGSFAVLSREMDGRTYKTDRFLRVSFDNEDATNQFTYEFFDMAGNKVNPKSMSVFKNLGDNKHVLDLRKHNCFSPGNYYTLEIKMRDYQVYKLRFEYTK